MGINDSILKFLVYFIIFKSISCNDNDKVILSHMQDWGKEIFMTLTGKNGTRAKGQYLVAALLSDDDLKTPQKMPGRLLKGCPADGPNKKTNMIMCSTSAVFLNRVSKEIWQRSPWKNDETYEDHPWHGEYILLNEGFIEQLFDNFGKEKHCQVYLYSFYIPCADIKGCPYWCSDEVAKFNNRGDTPCKITVIGYTEVFRRSNKTRTDLKLAVDRIKDAESHLFKNVKSVRLQAIKNFKERNKALAFQKLLYQCLIKTPLSGCCVSTEETSTEETSIEGTSSVGNKAIIAYFINKMVFEAIHEVKLDLKGKFSFEKYLEYFHSWTDKSISNQCNVCSFKKYHKLVIDFCMDRAMEIASGFGKPTRPRDLSHANWKYRGDSWNTLYPISPEEFRKNKMLLCAKRPMSVESMCTALEYVENEIPSKRMRPEESEQNRMD